MKVYGVGTGGGTTTREKKELFGSCVRGAPKPNSGENGANDEMKMSIRAKNRLSIKSISSVLLKS